MKLLLLSASPHFSPLKSHLQNFAEVHTLYSPFMPFPPADFPFALRWDTMEQVPWADYEAFAVLGGSRICSLAGEWAHFHGKAALLICGGQLYYQASSELVDLPSMAAPAFSSKKFTTPIAPEFFTQNSSIAPGGGALKLRQGEYFRSGHRCDLVSLACSEDTSSASSSDVLAFDLRRLAEDINQSGEASLQRVSDFFAEFLWRSKRLMIYRQGRVSLSPCDNPEEIFFAYQYFLNS